jgi:TATA-binding protein-associated factor Taf7
MNFQLGDKGGSGSAGAGGGGTTAGSSGVGTGKINFPSVTIENKFLDNGEKLHSDLIGLSMIFGKQEKEEDDDDDDDDDDEEDEEEEEDDDEDGEEDDAAIEVEDLEDLEEQEVFSITAIPKKREVRKYKIRRIAMQ